MKNKNNMKWKKLMLDYFDWNQDGETNWWEFMIPFVFILILEIFAELIGFFIIHNFIK